MKPYIKLSPFTDKLGNRLFVCVSGYSTPFEPRYSAYGVTMRGAYEAWLRLKNEAARRQMENLQNMGGAWGVAKP